MAAVPFRLDQSIRSLLDAEVGFDLEGVAVILQVLVEPLLGLGGRVRHRGKLLAQPDTVRRPRTGIRNRVRAPQ